MPDSLFHSLAFGQWATTAAVTDDGPEIGASFSVTRAKIALLGQPHSSSTQQHVLLTTETPIPPSIGIL